MNIIFNIKVWKEHPLSASDKIGTYSKKNK